MVGSLRELAHFGGWVDKGVVDSVSSPVLWGDPMVRNVEITPTNDTGPTVVSLQMPDDARVTLGAEYNVFVFRATSGTTAILQIQDYSGITLVRPDLTEVLITAGTAGEGEMVTVVWDGSIWAITGPYNTGSADRTASYTTSTAEWPAFSDVVDVYQDTANMVAKDIAISNGYDGRDGYRIVIRCHNMTIGSSSVFYAAFSTGHGWGLNCTVNLELVNSTVAGFGGAGGSTLSGSVEVAPGDGGDALQAYVPLLVIADSTSRITAGGGGGPTNGLEFGGGGGNGGNMTYGGAITGSTGGGGLPGENGGPDGSGGGIVEGGLSGGALAFNGGNWGAGIVGQYYTSTPGDLATAQGVIPITWSVSPLFRWGNSGTSAILPALPTTVSFA